MSADTLDQISGNATPSVLAGAKAMPALKVWAVGAEPVDDDVLLMAS